MLNEKDIVGGREKILKLSLLDYITVSNPSSIQGKKKTELILLFSCIMNRDKNFISFFFPLV